MVAVLAFAAILGGFATGLAAWPFLGGWAFAMVPLGGSLAIVVAGLIAGPRTPRPVAAAEPAVDAMVSNLRSVLPPAGPAPTPGRRAG